MNGTQLVYLNGFKGTRAPGKQPYRTEAPRGPCYEAKGNRAEKIASGGVYAYTVLPRLENSEGKRNREVSILLKFQRESFSAVIPLNVSVRRQNLAEIKSVLLLSKGHTVA